MPGRIASVPALLARHALLALALVMPTTLAAQQADTARAAPTAKELKAQATADSNAVIATEPNKYGTLPATWSFGVGGFWPTVSTSVQLSSVNLPGSIVNVERSLGVSPNTQSIDLSAGFRFKQKNMFTLEFFGFQRHSTKTISDSLILNDTVYHAGATLNATTGLNYYGLTYRYYFWRRQRWQLGFGLGIDAMTVGLKAGIKATVAGKSDSAKTEFRLTAPVPMLGMYAEWEAIPRLFLRGAFQTLFLSYQQYSGGIRDRRIEADWYPWKNYGVGLAYHYVGLQLKKTSDQGSSVTANYGLGGLSAYASAAFGAPEPVNRRPNWTLSEPPPTQDFGLVPRTLSAYLGFYGPSVKSNAQLSSPTNPGTDISLEDTLGLPNHVSSLDVGLALRIDNKSLLTASYFGFSRSGSVTLTDTIHFGNGTYVPGAKIDASGSLAYYGFTYRYYFLRKTRWQLGAGIGLDELDAKTTIGIKASIAGKEDSLQKSGSLAAPAPLLGIYADWEMFPRFYLRGFAEYISITVSTGTKGASIGGSINDDRISAEWYAFRNYAIGLGYHYVNLDATKTLANSNQVKFKYTIQGPSIYLGAAW